MDKTFIHIYLIFPERTAPKCRRGNKTSQSCRLRGFSQICWLYKWVWSLGDDELLLLPDVIDTSLCWGTFRSAHPAKSAEKLSMSQLKLWQRWRRGQSVRWMVSDTNVGAFLSFTSVQPHHVLRRSGACIFNVPGLCDNCNKFGLNWTFFTQVKKRIKTNAEIYWNKPSTKTLCKQNESVFNFYILEQLKKLFLFLQETKDRKCEDKCSKKLLFYAEIQFSSVCMWQCKSVKLCSLSMHIARYYGKLCGCRGLHPTSRKSTGSFWLMWLRDERAKQKQLAHISRNENTMWNRLFCLAQFCHVLLSILVSFDWGAVLHCRNVLRHLICQTEERQIWPIARTKGPTLVCVWKSWSQAHSMIRSVVKSLQKQKKTSTWCIGNITVNEQLIKMRRWCSGLRLLCSRFIGNQIFGEYFGRNVMFHKAPV